MAEDAQPLLLDKADSASKEIEPRCEKTKRGGEVAVEIRVNNRTFRGGCGATPEWVPHLLATATRQVAPKGISVRLTYRRTCLS
jgi:hypothetical protein